MRELVVIEFLSLDGVMQAPGDRGEDTEGGFEHGGWQRPYFDEILGAGAAEGMAATDAYLFGRKTYEIMAAHWPTAPADDPCAAHLNATMKYVASRTLERVDWQNSTLIASDLVDECSLMVFPVVLGSGKRLFRQSGQARSLKLLDAKTTTTGGLMLTYQPAR